MTAETPTAVAPTDNLADVPTVAEYKKAFLACRPALRSKGGSSLPMDMLKVNYSAAGHCVMAADLADEVGLASFKAANLRYGTFAKALCKELNRTPKVNLAILVTFSNGRPNEDTVQWTMLPQVVQALEELGWVRPEATAD